MHRLNVYQSPVGDCTVVLLVEPGSARAEKTLLVQHRRALD